MEKTLKFIEESSIEELQAELERYGVKFIPNPAKELKEEASIHDMNIKSKLETDYLYINVNKER